MGRTRVTPSASYSTPNLDANPFDLEAQNGGHIPERSYTPSPAETQRISPDQ